jgi:adenylate cyclase, class 2
MQNLELKAKHSGIIPNLQGFADDKGLLHQKDTYFCTTNGRLKLREEDEHVLNEKFSNYTFYPIEDPKLFMKVFGNALKTEVVVEKERRLYVRNNARIHFDNVINLGYFVEIEVVIAGGVNETDFELMKEIIGKLGIVDEDKISVGYREMLIDK